MSPDMPQFWTPNYNSNFKDLGWYASVYIKKYSNKIIERSFPISKDCIWTLLANGRKLGSIWPNGQDTQVFWEKCPYLVPDSGFYWCWPWEAVWESSSDWFSVIHMWDVTGVPDSSPQPPAPEGFWGVNQQAGGSFLSLALCPSSLSATQIKN